MWKYDKKLQYPVNITSPDLMMAKNILTQFGGPNGELAAALRYLTMRYSMPDDEGRALLTDIGTEELAHVEMISAMVYQLMQGSSLEDLKKAGLDGMYSEHGCGLYPTNAQGYPFRVDYFAITGDPVADLAENLAAEQKARAIYENLMNLTNRPDILAPLAFLRQREIVHYQRFLELYRKYEKQFKCK